MYCYFSMNIYIYIYIFLNHKLYWSIHTYFVLIIEIYNSIFNGFFFVLILYSLFPFCAFLLMVQVPVTINNIFISFYICIYIYIYPIKEKCFVFRKPQWFILSLDWLKDYLIIFFLNNWSYIISRKKWKIWEYLHISCKYVEFI